MGVDARVGAGRSLLDVSVRGVGQRMVGADPGGLRHGVLISALSEVLEASASADPNVLSRPCTDVCGPTVAENCPPGYSRAWDARPLTSPRCQTPWAIFLLCNRTAGTPVGGCFRVRIGHDM